MWTSSCIATGQHNLLRRTGKRGKLTNIKKTFNFVHLAIQIPTVTVQIYNLGQLENECLIAQYQTNAAVRPKINTTRTSNMRDIFV